MKIKIEPELRASCEAAVAEMSALLKRETDRSDELAKYALYVPAVKAEIVQLTAISGSETLSHQ